jgi:predicted outer membrane protein
MRTIQAITLGAVVLSAAVAAAQNNADPQRRDPQRQQEAVNQQAPRQQKSEIDRMFATCLAIENAAEIQVAENAAQRLQNAQAKEFAQKLVQDHRAMLEKLRQFGADDSPLRTTSDARNDVSVRTGRADVDVEVNRQAGDGRRPATTTGQTAATGQKAAGHLDFVAIKREIADQCVQSAQRELETSDDPDRCFIGAQVVGHQHMLDTLKVFQRHASPQLADTLAQASETTQQHLEQAKQILKSLDKQVATGGVSNRTGTTAR